MYLWYCFGSGFQPVQLLPEQALQQPELQQAAAEQPIQPAAELQQQ